MTERGYGIFVGKEGNLSIRGFASKKETVDKSECFLIAVSRRGLASARSSWAMKLCSDVVELSFCSTDRESDKNTIFSGVVSILLRKSAAFWIAKVKV